MISSIKNVIRTFKKQAPGPVTLIMQQKAFDSHQECYLSPSHQREACWVLNEETFSEKHINISFQDPKHNWTPRVSRFSHFQHKFKETWFLSHFRVLIMPSSKDTLKTPWRQPVNSSNWRENSPTPSLHHNTNPGNRTCQVVPVVPLIDSVLCSNEECNSIQNHSE